MKKGFPRFLVPPLWALGTFVVSCLVSSSVIAKENHGVPRIYGYSFLYVATDSMVGPSTDSLPQGTGILVRQCDPRTLHEGDIVSFYDRRIDLVNTHRLVEAPSPEGSGFRFHTKGDNSQSLLFVYEGEWFTEKEFIGVVTMRSDALAFLIAAFSPEVSAMASVTGNSWQPLLFPLFVLFPLGILSSITVIVTIKELLGGSPQESERRPILECSDIESRQI